MSTMDGSRNGEYSEAVDSVLEELEPLFVESKKSPSILVAKCQELGHIPKKKVRGEAAANNRP
jgi:hypothetical protein